MEAKSKGESMENGKMVKAYLSTFGRRQTAVGDGFASDSEAFSSMALSEARAILAESEGCDRRLLTLKGYAHVAGPERNGFPLPWPMGTLDPQATSALAESLATFISQGAL